MIFLFLEITRQINIQSRLNLSAQAKNLTRTTRGHVRPVGPIQIPNPHDVECNETHVQLQRLQNPNPPDPTKPKPISLSPEKTGKEKKKAERLVISPRSRLPPHAEPSRIRRVGLLLRRGGAAAQCLPATTSYAVPRFSFSGTNYAHDSRVCVPDVSLDCRASGT